MKKTIITRILDSVCATVIAFVFIMLLVKLLNWDSDNGAMASLIICSVATLIFIVVFCTLTIIHEIRKQFAGKKENEGSTVNEEHKS